MMGLYKDRVKPGSNTHNVNYAIGSIEHRIIYRYASSEVLSMGEEFVRVGSYPNTCEECPERGEMEYSYFGDGYEASEFYSPQGYWNEGEVEHTLIQKESKLKYWNAPKRCNVCHAKSERFRKANQTLKKLENIRELLEVNDINGEKWKYLKFVTLTWENQWRVNTPELNKKELAAARLSIRRKRKKIAEKLHCAGGTDVMENVVKTIYGIYPEYPSEYKIPIHKHHLHTHGVWIMPFHKSESILKVMKEHGIRDQCRAIKPSHFYDKRTGERIEYKAFSRARNYLLKYITKIEGCKRGNWGLARGEFCEAKFCEFLFS